MTLMRFELQRFAEVVHGTGADDYILGAGDRTQVYALGGNDTLEARGNELVLIGGSGDDVIKLIGGNGTISGGAGADIFNFAYSTEAPVHALVEDIEPDEDLIVLDYDVSPSLKYFVSGNDVILLDSNGALSVTLKGARSLDEYYDREVNEFVWDVFRIVNKEREKVGVSPLALSQEIMDAASVRADEQIELYGHTRPDGSSCYTALTNNVGYRGENVAAGYTSPEDVMIGWMNSSGHRANILSEGFGKLGVGYAYDADSDWKHHWVQMFRSNATSGEVLSRAELLSTKIFYEGELSSLSALASVSSNSASFSTVDVDAHSLFGGNANEFIFNGGADGTIVAGAGDDTLNAFGASGVIRGGLGNDLINISEEASRSTINGEGANDTIRNFASRSMILGGSGNDSIVNESSASLSALDAGESNDLILNYAARSTLNGGNGLDSIENRAEFVSIDGGSGIDTIRNYSASATIRGGTDNDLIENDSSASLSIIDGGDGYDSLTNCAASVSIDAGAGNDYIYNRASSVTLDAGLGNDTINLNYAHGNLIKFGGGNDVIINYDPSDTIRVTNGAFESKQYDGTNLTLKFSSGSIKLANRSANDSLTVVDASGKSVGLGQISGSNSADNLTNNEARVEISLGAGNDTLFNHGSNVSVKGTSGNNLIINGEYYAKGGTFFQVESGNGADTVINSGVYSKLYVGAGNNVVYNGYYHNSAGIFSTDAFGSQTTTTLNGSFTSINLGSGNDFVANRSPNVTIRSGAGNDQILLEDGSRVFVDAGNGNNSIVSGQYYSLGAPRSTLKTGSGADTIISHGSNSSINAGAGNDLIANGYFYYAPSHYFYANNSDGDATNTAVDGSNVIILGGDGNDSIKNNGANVTIEAGTGNDTICLCSKGGQVIVYTAGDGNDLVSKFGESDTLRIAAEDFSTQTLGNDVIVSVLGSSIGFVTLLGAASLVDKHNIIFVNDIDAIINTHDNTLVSGTSDADRIINAGANVTIQSGKGNDTLTSSGHGDLFLFSSADGNNLITNFGTNDSLKMTAGLSIDYKRSGSNMIVTLKGANYTGVETLKGAGSYRFKQSGSLLTVENSIYNTKSNTLVSGTSGNDSIKNSGKNVTIEGGAGDDTITGSNYGELFLFSSAHGNNLVTNFGVNDSIQMTTGKTIAFANAGNDMLVTLQGTYYTGVETLKGAGWYSFKRNDVFLTASAPSNKTIVGTSGADSIDLSSGGSGLTIQSGAGKDTITGSDHGDVFLFSSADGNNLITNFGTNDSIKMTAGNSISYKRSGSDMIVTLKGTSHTGVETLKGAGAYNFVRNGAFLFVENVISNARSNTLVSGTDGIDSIKSTGSRVTIQSGAGDDTITGSSYGELFLFSSADGNNLITNFGTNDSIKMTAGKSISYERSGSDMLVTLKGTSYTGIETLVGAGYYNFKKSGTYLIASAPSNKLIVGSSKADSIDLSSGGSGLTIQSGAGNDSIIGSDYGDLFLFSSADGNNLITNFGTNDSIKMTAGNSITYKRSGNDMLVTIKGASHTGVETLKGAGNYRFKKSGAFLTVENVINNARSNTLVSGTSGDDSIKSTGSRVTIESGAGEDTITGSSYGEFFLFSSADGNNLITNFGVNDSIKMTAGKTITFENEGADMLVTLKGTSYTGVETLKGAGWYNFKKSGAYLIASAPSNKKIVGSSGADSINLSSGGEGLTIQSGAGNDTIIGSNSGDLFLFSSADGNNLITNFGTNDSIKMTAGKTISYKRSGNDMLVTLKGTSYTGVETLKGAGNYRFKKSGAFLTVENMINNARSNTLVSGTSGDDSITSTGSRVTIQSGAGEDTITGSSYGDLFLFSSADGNNLITNFGTNDSIKITAGSIKNYYASGSDYIVEAQGAKYSGTITLGGAAQLGSIKVSGKTLTLAASNAQLPSEEYWFTQADQAVDELETLLNRAALAPLVDTDLDRNEIEKMIGVDALKVSAVACQRKKFER